jgi:virginiamycin A acetyltransferase
MFNLADQADVTKGNIRGPFGKWDIKGAVFCGQYSSINGILKSRGRVTIGKYCAFGNNVSLIANNHDTGYFNQQVWLQSRLGCNHNMTTKGPIVIGNNVWIGDNVIITDGVTIGDGAVIGAGSVVTKNVEPFDIVAGVPAKVIKSRFHKNVIDQLLKIKWWDWPEDKMTKNKDFFNLNLSNDQLIDLSSYL